MRLSVIVPTYRVGGLDVLCESLARQSFREFELVVVDGIYEYRRSLVAKMAKNYPFAIKHVEPRDNPFPLNSYCRYVNTALSKATGDVALILPDYASLSPRCLEEHARFQATLPEGDEYCLYMVGVEHVRRPELREGVPTYGPNPLQIKHAEQSAKHEEMLENGMLEYLYDLKTGRLSHAMWSTFVRTPSYSDAGNLDVEWRHSISEGTSPASNSILQNESIPLSALEEVNGLDEDYDGSHLYQDTDLAERLVKSGRRWFANPRTSVRVINPRTFLYVRRFVRPYHSNQAYLTDKRAAGFPPVNPGWNLRKARKALT